MFAITLSQFIIYLLGAIVCGYVVEWVFRSRMWLGFPGAVLAGLGGIFVVVNVWRLKLVPFVIVEGVSLASLLVGAAGGAILWGLISTLVRGRLSIWRYLSGKIVAAQASNFSHHKGHEGHKG